MKTNTTADTVLKSVTSEVPFAARDEKALQMPEPQQEHAWLTQFVGEWLTEVEVNLEPGKPALRYEGMESVRALGGFWVVSDYKGTFMDRPFSGVFTLGYDVEKQKYVATWVDSATSHCWMYEGTLDEKGQVLTLYGEGTCASMPGKLLKVRDTIEFKDNENRVLTSARQGDDGQWVTGMTIHYRRRQSS